MQVKYVRTTLHYYALKKINKTLHDKQQAAAVEIGQQRRFKPPLNDLSGGW
jgi:hypothetical protein